MNGGCGTMRGSFSRDDDTGERQRKPGDGNDGKGEDIPEGEVPGRGVAGGSNCNGTGCNECCLREI